MRPGKFQGQLEIYYTEEKQQYSEGVQHKQCIKAEKDIDADDEAQKALDALLQKGTAKFGKKRLAIEDDSTAINKRPASLSLPGAAPAAPKKKPGKDANRIVMEQQLEATNSAVKTAHSKMTALKADVIKDHGRISGLESDRSRDQRQKTCALDDLQEVIDGCAPFISELLVMIGSKQSTEHMPANINYMYEIAQFMADAKVVVDRCKKIKF